MFFSIFHALIPNFYVLFSIVYSLFFVLGELSWFSTPFSVFYNKWVGLPAFAFLASSQPAGFSTPFNISSLTWVKMLVNYTLYTLFHLHFPYSLIVHITTYFLSITYNCPLLPTILYFVPTSWKVSLTQVSNNSLLRNILTSLTHASFQQVFIVQHPERSHSRNFPTILYCSTS